MPEITDADDPLPIFIPEWTVWDKAINHHYEKGSLAAKDFLYTLLLKRASTSTELACIPNELYEALKGEFKSKTAFGFLIENGAAVERLPEIFLKAMPSPIPHEVAVFMLAFWKMLNFKDVYIVTEDKDFNKIIESLSLVGLKITNIKSLSCKQARTLLNKIP